jgi:hypothetical protein
LQQTPWTGTGGSGEEETVTNPFAGAPTNRSGTITTGGTSQQLAPAVPNRSYLFIQNLSAGDLWIDFSTPAVVASPSIKIVSGAAFVMEASFVASCAVNVIGATTGQAWSGKEF